MQLSGKSISEEGGVKAKGQGRCIKWSACGVAGLRLRLYTYQWGQRKALRIFYETKNSSKLFATTLSLSIDMPSSEADLRKGIYPLPTGAINWLHLPESSLINLTRAIKPFTPVDVATSLCGIFLQGERRQNPYPLKRFQQALVALYYTCDGVKQSYPQNGMKIIKKKQPNNFSMLRVLKNC